MRKRIKRRTLMYVILLVLPVVVLLGCQKKVSVSEPLLTPQIGSEELALAACSPTEKEAWRQFGQNVEELREICVSNLDKLSYDLKKIKSDKLKKLVKKYKAGLLEK